MRLFSYVLELADGSQIQVGRSPYSNAPLVLKSDVPAGRLQAFSDVNPPKGMRQTSQTAQHEMLLTTH